MVPQSAVQKARTALLTAGETASRIRQLVADPRGMSKKRTCRSAQRLAVGTEARIPIATALTVAPPELS